MRYFSLLFIVFLLAGCGDTPIAELEQYGKEPFNSEQWRQKQNRLSMVWSLSKDKLICTQTTTQIIDLLGQPDAYYISDMYKSWVLSSTLTFVIDIPYGKDKPELFFLGDLNDTVAEFSCP